MVFIFDMYVDMTSALVVVGLALCLTLMQRQGRIRGYKAAISVYSNHSLDSVDRLLDSLDENADVALRGLKAYESRVLQIWSKLLERARYYDNDSVVDSPEQLEETLNHYLDALQWEDWTLELEAIEEIHCIRDRFYSLAYSARIPGPLRQQLKAGIHLLFHWVSTTRYLMNRLHKKINMVV